MDAPILYLLKLARKFSYSCSNCFPGRLERSRIVDRISRLTLYPDITESHLLHELLQICICLSAKICHIGIEDPTAQNTGSLLHVPYIKIDPVAWELLFQDKVEIMEKSFRTLHDPL